MTKNRSYDTYEQYAYDSLIKWVKKVDRPPAITDMITSGIQNRINKLIPNKVHNAITAAVKGIIKSLLTGSEFINHTPKSHPQLRITEDAVRDVIKHYKTTGAVEGGLTGAGGFLWSLADFPLLLGIKIKMLYSIAAHYGYDTSDVKERFFMLLILQQAFSSDKIQRETYHKVRLFEKNKHQLPNNINDMDWRTLQQQYRDYLDLAKLLQMVPIIGSVVGTVANFRLVNRLGNTAMQCYRIRYFQKLHNDQLQSTHSPD